MPHDPEDNHDEELPPVEFTESGTPILRHSAPEADSFQVGPPSPFAEAIEAHIERHIGPISNVFHELVSPLVHVDILCVLPTDERPFHTLITCGMSARPMNVPPEIKSQLGVDARFAELLICLPPEWKMSQDAWSGEENYWPIRWLKMLARLPHEYGTWLWEGHTIPNGDPPEPFASDTALCCAMLAPPLTLDPNAHTLRTEDEAGEECEIAFFAMQTLHADEIAFKLKRGGEALFEKLDEHQVSEVLDVSRASVAPPTSRS